MLARIVRVLCRIIDSLHQEQAKKNRKNVKNMGCIVFVRCISLVHEPRLCIVCVFLSSCGDGGGQSGRGFFR